MKKLLAAALLSAAPLLGAEGWHVVRTLPAGGEGGWDYLALDPSGTRLFVTRGSRVDVLDPRTGKKLGEVPGTAGVHGVVFDELGNGWASCGRAGTVTVFDAKTLAVKARVPVTGETPDAILYDRATKRVFTLNGRGKNATAVDTKTLAVAGTVAIGGKPEFPQSDGKGTIWVNVEDTAELVALDAKALAVTRRVKLAGCEEPTGLAWDVAAGRLFSACGGNATLVVTDAAAGKVLQTLPIGKGCDGVALLDGEVFASNGEGSVTVIRREGERYAVAATVPTQPSARTIAADPARHELFLPAARFAPGGSFVVLVVGKGAE